MNRSRVLPSVQKFFSCDWGTTRLRVRLVRCSDLRVLAFSESDQGVLATFASLPNRRPGAATRARVFFAVLRPHLERVAGRVGLDYRSPLVISGMASSTLGVRELPYARVPFALDGSGLLVERLGPVRNWPLNTLLVSGVRTGTDIMRGEETQVVGWAQVSGKPPERGVVLLPGTHSKHIIVDRGRVIGFATYMTGEFFELLSKHGMLAKTVRQRPGIPTAGDRVRFAQGVRVGAQENLLHAGFLVRTRTVLAGVSSGGARQFLSGLLLGAELAALANSGLHRVDIVADLPLHRLYEKALRILGFRGTIRRYSASEAVIGGHARIARQHQLFAG